MECINSEGDDPIIDDNAPRKILPGLFFVTLLQELQSSFLILLLNLFPLLYSLILLADVPPIEDTNRLDIVIRQDFKHFQDVV